MEIKIYKEKNGDFKKATIELDDQETLNTVFSGLVHKFKATEEMVNTTSLDFVREKEQKELDCILDLFKGLSQPTIIKNERAELLKKLREV